MKIKSLQRGCFAIALVTLLAAPLAAMAQGGQGRFMSGAPSVVGAVTAVSATEITIKNASGDIYKVALSANTRIMKDRQPATSSDLKVGDTVAAVGVVDIKAKTVAAAFVAELDAEQAKQMQERLANYGKTWLAGKVETMGEGKLTLAGNDGKPASIVLNETTSMQKQGDSITLADIKVGDQVRVEGEVKGGSFVASTLNVMVPRPPRQN